MEVLPDLGHHGHSFRHREAVWGRCRCPPDRGRGRPRTPPRRGRPPKGGADRPGSGEEALLEGHGSNTAAACALPGRSARVLRIAWPLARSSLRRGGPLVKARGRSTPAAEPGPGEDNSRYGSRTTIGTWLRYEPALTSRRSRVSPGPPGATRSSCVTGRQSEVYRAFNGPNREHPRANGARRRGSPAEQVAANAASRQKAGATAITAAPSTVRLAEDNSHLGLCSRREQRVVRRGRVLLATVQRRWSTLPAPQIACTRASAHELHADIVRKRRCDAQAPRSCISCFPLPRARAHARA